MVLESLLKARSAEKRPYLVFFLGILYSSIAILVSWLLFRHDNSMVFVSVIVFASIPLMFRIIKLEEKKDRKIMKETSLLKEHKKALIAFMALFFGIMVSLSLWYIFLPQDNVDTLFESQIREVNIVEGKFSGNVVKPSDFTQIFLNNARVLGFSFLFSLFFGAGAIFILAWNASLIAVALGSFVRDSLGSFSSS